MWIPNDFHVDDRDELTAFMKAHSFAALVSTVEGGLFASHLPFMVERRGDDLMLLAHMARANPQWRELEGQESLVVFNGPHAYISPDWYESRANVPTWDYMAVHALGSARILRGEADARNAVARLSEINEASFPKAWSLDEMPEERVRTMLRAIVPFEIRVQRLYGKYKLSQNRTPADRKGVVAGLRQLGLHSLANEIEERS